MDKSKFYSFLNEMNTKLLIQNINKDFTNLEDVYRNNLAVWFYNNSDERSAPAEEFEPVNGCAKDPSKLNYSKTQDEFEITEEDFISEQFADLAKLDSSKLQRKERKQLKAYLEFLEQRVRELSKKKVPSKNFNKNWFKIGLLFATGEMNQLIKEYNSNSHAIARYLNPEKPNSIRPYISDSIGNSANRDKNIFSRPNYIKEIQSYCTENQIEMTSEFAELFPE